MTNNIFPELDGWDEILNTHLTDKNLVSLIKATQKLVLSLASLRSGVSSHLGYLKNKIGDLQNSVEQLNDSFKILNDSIKSADKSSTDLSKALNRLTFFGVSVAFLGVGVAIIQFLFENKIWPFLS